MNELVAIEKIAQWEKLKMLVLDGVSSPITKGVYNMALNEFRVWLAGIERLRIFASALLLVACNPLITGDISQH
jgi:hypothetical protein